MVGVNTFELSCMTCGHVWFEDEDDRKECEAWFTEDL